jgi:cytochrome c
MKKAAFWGMALAFSTLGMQAGAQCVKPGTADWQKVILVDGNSAATVDKPIHMAILPDGRVFMAEMWTGRIKLFTPGAGVTLAGSVTPYADHVENGLLGIAVDPAFATNKWVYVFYSRKLPGPTYSAGDGNISPHEHVLARFTFSGTTLSSPKDVLIFPRQGARHAAGGLAFNKLTGDLFITTGDDTFPGSTTTHWGGRNETSYWLNSLRTSGNTNDLRGKVLRIRPMPFPDTQTPAVGVGTTYTIPAGNLFPVGMAKTRPEIFTMGHRNPYHIKVDDASGIALIGEVGPDAAGPAADRGPTGSDEFNLLAEAGNFGWPFAIASNQPYVVHDGEAYTKGVTFDVNNLKNLSKFNTGIQDLPPAKGALAYYNALNSQTGPNTVFGSGGESAIAGPYYRYDAALPAVKLPPYFQGKFIVGDWVRGKIWILELNSQKVLTKVENLFNAQKVIDLDIGPKGELYVLELASGGGYEGEANTGTLYKMEYKGAQYAANLCTQPVFPNHTTGIGNGEASARSNPAPKFLNPALTRQIAAPAGKSRGSFFSLSGVKLWQGDARDGVLTLPSTLGANLGFLRFE